MLGNQREAEEIYFSVKGWFEGYGRRIPKGWKALGHGTYRHCYLSPSGVVYKICFSYYSKWEDETDDNIDEYLNYLRIRKAKIKVKGWRLARMKPYYFTDGDLAITVNGQEYIQGYHEKYDGYDTDQARRIESAFDAFILSDGHEENFLVTPRGNVIIDYST